MGVNASGLKVTYDEVVAVTDMNINIDKREITTIIGPNGSGKSTILKALTRLIKFQEGSVYIDGRELGQYKTRELSRRIAVLPQVHSAPEDFRVKELVSYGRMPYQKLLKGQSAEDRRIIDWAMHATGIYHLREKSIYEVSGGEGQRVWIATVLTQQPEILFLDEPTTYLDISYQYETMKLIKQLNRQTGIGVVMVLHDLSQALEISDRIVIIKDGRKYSEGTPDQVITRRMMMDVYNVRCDIVRLNGRTKPIIVYNELTEQDEEV